MNDFIVIYYDRWSESWKLRWLPALILILTAAWIASAWMPRETDLYFEGNITRLYTDMGYKSYWTRYHIVVNRTEDFKVSKEVWLQVEVGDYVKVYYHLQGIRYWQTVEIYNKEGEIIVSK